MPGAELPVVVIGAGAVGYALIRALRARNPDLAIILIAADDAHFYSKPTLSVSISKQSHVSGLILRSGERMREEFKFQLLARTRVSKIDVKRRELHSSRGVIAYCKLVLALGATPTIPNIPGLQESERVFVLNALDDYEKLSRELSEPRRVAVLGAGFVGVELANDLRRAQHEVFLIDRAPEPLPRLVPEPVGARLRAGLQKEGVDCRFGVTPRLIANSRHDLVIQLDDGAELNVDILICAAGQRAADELPSRAGLATEQGVLVDSRLCTSDEQVFALGDCARILPFNLQFIAPIAPCAAVAAANVIGLPARLSMPALAVTVKTPCFPIVSSAGARDPSWRWSLDEDEFGISALAYDSNGGLQAFALGGSHVARRSQYLPLLPALLATNDSDAGESVQSLTHLQSRVLHK